MGTKNVIRLRNFGRGNQDSDQSISEEEEDLEGEETGTMISLDGLEGNKGSVQVLSQLEVLRDSYELHSTKELISSHERKGGYSKDDGLGFSLFDEDNVTDNHLRSSISTHTKPNAGMPYLPTMVSISHSDEEIISDDEKIDRPTLGSERGTVDCTWSEASREVEALVCINDNSCCPPLRDSFVKERKFSKGAGGEGRNIAKPKFVFLHDSCKDDLSMVISERHGRTSSENSPTLDEIEAAAEEDSDELLSDSQPIYLDKESQGKENRIVPFEQAQKHDFNSMAEFLCSFYKSSNQLQGRIEHDIKKGERRMPIVVKGNTSELGDTNQAEDDPLEFLDSGSPLSSDDEENHQNLQLVVPCRTMTDQFHEAFGTVSAIDDGPHITSPWPLSNGMHGKLQQVMQREKERDMVYLKKLSEITGFNEEKTCITVRILTRALEAKLIVCSCAPVEDRKGSYWESNVEIKFKKVQRTLTIIFNPRITKDVELEVGNVICIHPPWKEVPVKEKDEVIYLCSYFTQIKPVTILH